MEAVVHIALPTTACTFTDYVIHHFVPFLKSQSTQSVTQVDAIWDTYPEDIIKTLVHQCQVQVHTPGLGIVIQESLSMTGIVDFQTTLTARKRCFLFAASR